MKNPKVYYAKKELYHSMNRSKSQLAILVLMIFLTSFMYFFVQCSIDGNRKILTQDQVEFQVALNTNAVLAGGFLVALLVITTFIVYMFYRNYFQMHKKEIGCFKALGILDSNINRICILFISRLAVLATTAGMAIGWCASSILNNAYIASYGINKVKKGIAFTSFFYGIILVTLVLALITYVAGRKVLYQEAAILISNSDNKKENPIIDKLSNLIARITPKKFRFSVRIAMRKPLTILLTMIAVLAAMTLFIISVSLNLSSHMVYASQTEGHTYKFDTKYDTYLFIQDKKTTEGIRYIEEEIIFTVPSNKTNTISQNIVGLEKCSKLFTLFNKKGEQIALPTRNQIIASIELEEVYGVKIGDTILIRYKNHEYPCVVADIARNATQKCIYISKDTLCDWIGKETNVYNGLLSMNKPTEQGESLSMTERLEVLDRAAVSNRTSAIINQVLGGVLGCLLIYLVILLNFSDSMKEILTLHLLGYQAKQINTMLISIYRPIIGVAFLIMLYPSIFICKSIQRSLSIQTNDYMPFQTNVLVIFFVFIMLNLIYSLVEYSFGKKIEKIISNEEVQEQLF